MTYPEPTRLQLLEVEYLIAVTAATPDRCPSCNEINAVMAPMGEIPIVSYGQRLSVYDVGRRHLLADHNYAHTIEETRR